MTCNTGVTGITSYCNKRMICFSFNIRFLVIKALYTSHQCKKPFS